MKSFKNHFYIIVIIFVWIGLHQSCTHDPTFLDDMEPDPMDTIITPIDTTDPGIPCDPDVVYFKKDVLQIFLSNCAISGCHNAASANDGVVLDNYGNIFNTGDVEPFKLNNTKIYEVITEDDPDKMMPPTGKLDNAEINLIAQWILQGAKNLECDEEIAPCVVENVTYSGFVSGVLNTYCKGCHGTGIASGGITTDNYNSVKTIADNGRLYGAISWGQGFPKMPQGQSQLDSCTLDKIKSWIDAGAQNN